MNLIAELTARIEDYRATNKQPCKNYATEAAAEKATAMAARHAANCLVPKGAGQQQEEPARYVVFYVKDWGRWVGCVDFTELLRRKGAGGYIGAIPGFFTY